MEELERKETKETNIETNHDGTQPKEEESPSLNGEQNGREKKEEGEGIYYHGTENNNSTLNNYSVSRSPNISVTSANFSVVGFPTEKKFEEEDFEIEFPYAEDNSGLLVLHRLKKKKKEKSFLNYMESSKKEELKKKALQKEKEKEKEREKEKEKEKEKKKKNPPENETSSANAISQSSSPQLQSKNVELASIDSNQTSNSSASESKSNSETLSATSNSSSSPATTKDQEGKPILPDASTSSASKEPEIPPEDLDEMDKLILKYKVKAITPKEFQTLSKKPLKIEKTKARKKMEKEAEIEKKRREKEEDLKKKAWSLYQKVKK